MVPFLFALKYYYVQKILFRRLTVICHLADHFFHSILRIPKNNDGTKEKRWGVYFVSQDFRLDYYADAWNNESASVGFTIILEMVTDASPSVYVQSPAVHVPS
jgi:hypothetical protein